VTFNLAIFATIVAAAFGRISGFLDEDAAQSGLTSHSYQCISFRLQAD